MNQELMKLYKDYGSIRCGVPSDAHSDPDLLRVLLDARHGGGVANSQFLWVHDLSQPDTITHILDCVNILPLLMAGTMSGRCRSRLKRAIRPAAHVMFMPLIFVFFTYNFASALALYYTVQNILSIFQLYVTRNQCLPR